MEEQFNRRQSDRFKQESGVRKDIMEQMSEIDDPTYRVMLTMMLRMQDETQTEIAAMHLSMQAYMHQINIKLDKLTKTEDEIKKSVLNGHSETHHDDHNWIREQRKFDQACGLVLHKHGEDGLCDHARQMIEDREVAKRRQWKVMDGLAEKAVWLVVMFLGGLVVAKLFPGVL
jgi:hypothetical protein